MTRFLRLLCGCTRVHTHESVEEQGPSNNSEYGGVGSAATGPPKPTGAQEATDGSFLNSDILASNYEQASRASTDCLADAPPRELQAAPSLARRRSSSNVEALAPLAEDDTLAPMAQGSRCLADDGSTLEVHWTLHEASRSSCPTIAARGCTAGVGLESCGGPGQVPRAYALSSVNGKLHLDVLAHGSTGGGLTGQLQQRQQLRSYSHASASKAGFCVSPVSTATARSLASPMRHDFMTLMRQASNRGSSNGIPMDSAPSPLQLWSPSLGADASRTSVGSATRVEWSTVRQSHGGSRPAPDMARYGRQRRSSAFAASNCIGRDGGGSVTVSGNMAGTYCPPCPLPIGAAAATIARCSSSPDIRPGGLLLARACGDDGSSGQPAASHAQQQPRPPPHTAQPFKVEPGCGKGNGGNGSGGMQLGGGVQLGGARSCHPGSAGCSPSGRSSDMRAVHLAHSPLRPRDLPPTASATGYSSSALPKRCAAGSAQTSPAHANTSDSYQQTRLLQQLREQHERSQKLQLSSSGTAGGADMAGLVRAELPSEVKEAALEVEGKLPQLVPWMADSYFAVLSGAGSVASVTNTGEPAAVDGMASAKLAATSCECSGMLPSGQSAAMPSEACALNDKSSVTAGEALSQSYIRSSETADWCNQSGPGPAASASRTAPAAANTCEAMLVVQNLLHRNALLDSPVLLRGPQGETGRAALAASQSGNAIHRLGVADAAAVAPSSAEPPNAIVDLRNCARQQGFQPPRALADPMTFLQAPSGAEASPTSGADGGRGASGSRGFCVLNVRRDPWDMLLDSARLASEAAVDGSSTPNPASARQGGASGAVGAGWPPHQVAVAMAADPGLLLSRAASPALDSFAGSGLSTRCGTPLLSPQPSERGASAAAVAAASGGAEGAGAACVPPPSRARATHTHYRTSSVCSPDPSLVLASPMLLDTAPPSSAAYGDLRATFSTRSLSGQPSSSAAALSNRSIICSSNTSGTRDAAVALSSPNAPRSAVARGNAFDQDAADQSPARSTCSSATGGGTGGAVHSAGGAAALFRARGSMGAGRGSSIHASETSLTAIAILRSAASTLPLPEDGSQGSNRTLGALPTAGGSIAGLDALPAITSASTSLHAAGTATGSASAQCVPLSLFASVAWPAPSAQLQLAASELLPQSQSVGGQGHAHVETGLRLEDGLVADPLLLIDGLGQLSYVTSGAYAAVYRGALDNIPVGIKFLASTSLDLNAPAVKEALLGPGLEHDNIIRTYTTRVARVDGRAVAQLKAVAAAMAAGAAAALRRKRSSATGRRFSSGTPQALSSPFLTSSAAAAASATCSVRQRSAVHGPSSAATTTCASPTSITSPSTPRRARATPPLSPCGTSSRCSVGGPYSPAQAYPYPHQLPQPTCALPADSAPCNAVFPAEPSPQVARAAGSLSGMGSAAADLSAAHCLEQGEGGVVAVRLNLMRRSASANARADTTGCGSAQDGSPPELPALRQLAADTPPARSGSAQLPSNVGSLQPQQLQAQVAGSRGSAPRGSAAERMLDVLRTLAVVGPSGQLTAEAHYVTAVVMEFADAGNLDTLSKDAAPCDLATAVGLLRQVARGMSYLHAHGLVHGDLKPANVLLCREPSSGRLVAKVADFGLSGLSGQLGTSGGADACGTIAYSAPERLAEDGTSEQAADVYSFAICMQQLVSGERPFADMTFEQTMFGVLCRGMRPEWPVGRCDALEPLYDMCSESQAAKRPTFDQVVAWLDSLWF